MHFSLLSIGCVCHCLCQLDAYSLSALLVTVL